jgi:hypothetical protein
MNKDNKINNETRVEKSTMVSKWRPSNLLEAPEPRPGFAQRWVATMVLGQETPTNVAKRLREGWQPRDIKSVKDGQHFPTIEHGKFAGHIGIEGMVLCEMPEEMEPIQRSFKSRVSSDGN